jgi:hypothetical protein
MYSTHLISALLYLYVLHYMFITEHCINICGSLCRPPITTRTRGSLPQTVPCCPASCSRVTATAASAKFCCCTHHTTLHNLPRLYPTSCWKLERRASCLFCIIRSFVHPSRFPLLNNPCIHLDAIFRIFPCHFLRLHLHSTIRLILLSRLQYPNNSKTRSNLPVYPCTLNGRH